MLENLGSLVIQGPAIRIAGIIVGAMVAQGVVVAVVRRLPRVGGEMRPYNRRLRSLSSLVTNTTATAVVLVAIMMVLAELGIQIAPLLASVGIVGLALSFGAQTLVRDFVTGFFLLLEGSFDEGEVIRTAGVQGEVVRLGLRTVTLRDEDGTLHTIPNGAIGLVSNLSRKETPTSAERGA